MDSTQRNLYQGMQRQIGPSLMYNNQLYIYFIVVVKLVAKSMFVIENFDLGQDLYIIYSFK